ncbi:MAG: hypothetical protein E6717_05420 [Veillonella parvula]|nr:hypothetical protein [Veillonella parvula]
MAEWVMKKLKDIADFNPRESLAKGTVAKKSVWISCSLFAGMYRDMNWSHSPAAQNSAMEIRLWPELLHAWRMERRQRSAFLMMEK